MADLGFFNWFFNDRINMGDALLAVWLSSVWIFLDLAVVYFTIAYQISLRTQRSGLEKTDFVFKRELGDFCRAFVVFCQMGVKHLSI